MLRFGFRRAGEERVPVSVFQLPDGVQPEPTVRVGRPDGTSLPSVDRPQPGATGSGHDPNNPRLPATAEVSR